MYQTSAIPGTSVNPQPLSTSANLNNTLVGFNYDAAGNLTQDGSSSSCTGAVAYAYNAEEQMSCAEGILYTYDGDGGRVKKSSGMLYWGGEEGAALAESDLSGNIASEYIFVNGTRIARKDAGGSVYYYLSDHLGSSNVVTNATGTIENESDYYPYGGENVITQNLSNHYKFTGKERDAESGNDYFGARYYGSSMGRFSSPDDGSDQNSLSPQSWNLYSYGRNNPVTNTDDDGHSVQICDTNGKCNTVDNPTYDKAASGNNGGLNVPSEKSVERTGSGNITDSSGNVVGTVKYVVDGGLDGPANLAGANMIGNGGMAAIKEFVVQSTIGAVTEGIGQGIGIGIDALRVARAANAAEAAEALAVAERVTQHAYLKHAGEFGNISRNEFQGLVQETMANPSEVRSLSNGRTAYWSDSQQMVVIENGTAPTQSTAFRPTGGKGYFDNLR